MKYKADISLEQRQAVLAALLEIWRCIYNFFVHACIAWKQPVEPQASQKWLWKVDNPSAKALVPKQARMQKAKSEIKTVALDLTRQLQLMLEVSALLWAQCQVWKVGVLF